MVAREQLSFRLSTDIKELLESLCERLGGPKYKILEASIEAFAALPKEAQYVLKTQDENDRKVILDHIRAMNLKPARGKHA